MPKKPFAGPGPGRPKGMPNKTTARARQAVAKFVDDHSAKLDTWLDEIYEKHGAKEAFNCFAQLLEYSVPKLQRTENVGEDGGPMQHSVKVEFVGNKDTDS